MNIKSFLSYLTGYWFHKRSTLPIGVDLFHDIQYRFRYKNISVVFDVGANIGQTAHWVRHHISSSRIYCFEPIRSVYEQLVKITGSIKKIKTESLAFGDKKLLEDLLIKNMINRPEALLPSNQTMRADVDLFVVNAYQKLYNRSPNELEVFTLKKNINENAQMTSVMVYYAMMTSDEYRYY